MDTIYLDDYLSNKIIKEKEFRQKIEETNWEKYSDKKVLIKGCAKSPVPTWAYILTALVFIVIALASRKRDLDKLKI